MESALSQIRKGMARKKLNKNFSVRTIAYTGVLAALVFAGSTLRIMIPLSDGTAAIHLGNLPCLLSGLVLGPWFGGLAAGIGSFIYDLGNPVYAPEAWITFISKFALAMVCGLIANPKNGSPDFRRRVVAVLLGSMTYTALYILKSYLKGIYVSGLTPEASLIALLPKFTASVTNAAGACVTAVPVSIAVEKAVRLERRQK